MHIRESLHRHSSSRPTLGRRTVPVPVVKGVGIGLVPKLTGRMNRLFAVRDGATIISLFGTGRPFIARSPRSTEPVRADRMPRVDDVDVAEAIYEENRVRVTVLTPLYVSAMMYGHLKYTHVRDGSGREQIRVAEDHVQHPQMVLPSKGETVVAAGFMTVSPMAVRIDGKSENFPTGTFKPECGNPTILERFPAILAQHRAGLSRTFEFLSELLKDHGLNIKVVD